MVYGFRLFDTCGKALIELRLRRNPFRVLLMLQLYTY